MAMDLREGFPITWQTVDDFRGLRYCDGEIAGVRDGLLIVRLAEPCGAVVEC